MSAVFRSDFPAGRFLQQLAILAVMSQMRQPFDALPIMSGQLPNQQDILPDACSVVPHARCLHDCATRHTPSQFISTAELPPKQQHLSVLAACASRHQLLLQVQASALTQLQLGQALLRCRLQPSAAFRAHPFLDAGFSPQLHLGHIPSLMPHHLHLQLDSFTQLTWVEI